MWTCKYMYTLGISRVNICRLCNGVQKRRGRKPNKQEKEVRTKIHKQSDNKKVHSCSLLILIPTLCVRALAVTPRIVFVKQQKWLDIFLISKQNHIYNLKKCNTGRHSVTQSSIQNMPQGGTVQYKITPPPPLPSNKRNSNNLVEIFSSKDL